MRQLTNKAKAEPNHSTRASQGLISVEPRHKKTGLERNQTLDEAYEYAPAIKGGSNKASIMQSLNTSIIGLK